MLVKIMATRVLPSLALVVATNLAADAGPGEMSSLDPPVDLPNGEPFRTWEAPLEFSRTYHVDQSRPNASDDNDGTRAERR